MRILIAGDWHGQWGPAIDAINAATREGIQQIIQVGDFGYFTKFKSTIEFLDIVSAKAVPEDVHIHAVIGNHDDPDEWEHIVNNYPRSSIGSAMIRRNVYLIPKVHRWQWAHKEFFVAGGAASIDEQYRVRGLSWWPNEVLTTDDMIAAKAKADAVDNKVDYLFTHDQSTRTPFGFRLFDHAASQFNRERIDDILTWTRPDMHFAGHYHKLIHWDNWTSDYRTDSWGLNFEDEYGSLGILDTTTNEFELI